LIVPKIPVFTPRASPWATLSYELVALALVAVFVYPAIQDARSRRVTALPLFLALVAGAALNTHYVASLGVEPLQLSQFALSVSVLAPVLALQTLVKDIGSGDALALATAVAIDPFSRLYNIVNHWFTHIPPPLLAYATALAMPAALCRIRGTCRGTPLVPFIATAVAINRCIALALLLKAF